MPRSRTVPLNGPALQRKLPKWKGVAVLSHNPWQGEAPDWWEVQAAVQALAQEDDAVVVDAGRGEMIVRASCGGCWAIARYRGVRTVSGYCLGALLLYSWFD